VPGPYLALLEDISTTALAVVLSVPTFREQRHPEPCAKVCVAPLLYLNLDSLPYPWI